MPHLPYHSVFGVRLRDTRREPPRSNAPSLNQPAEISALIGCSAYPWGQVYSGLLEAVSRLRNFFRWAIRAGLCEGRWRLGESGGPADYKLR